MRYFPIVTALLFIPVFGCLDDTTSVGVNDGGFSRDHLRGGKEDNWGDWCELANHYGDGTCDPCPTPDPDCEGGRDWCVDWDYYADGICDPCPTRDPDCAVGGDWCFAWDAYGNGICDACPSPDPDCVDFHECLTDADCPDGHCEMGAPCTGADCQPNQCVTPALPECVGPWVDQYGNCRSANDGSLVADCCLGLSCEDAPCATGHTCDAESSLCTEESLE